MEFPRELLTHLQAAEKVVVFTGAGASAESGIPTFRDALTGLWENFDPMALATPQAFDENPPFVWGWYEWRRALVANCEPNPAHYAIAEMQNYLSSLVVVTQNVDDLHERAGAKDIVRLHGSMHHPYCRDCHLPYTLGPVTRGGGEEVPPPQCPQCQGLVRPGVVWFGESLPSDAWERALEEAAQCDVLLSVGTSSVVYPAADIPRLAKEQGACLVQVNPDETGLEPFLDFSLQGPAGEILPALVEAAYEPA